MVTKWISFPDVAMLHSQLISKDVYNIDKIDVFKARCF